MPTVRNILCCCFTLIYMTSCKQTCGMKSDNIFIDTTLTLYAFYPNYSSIKWICTESPSMENDSILFCCTAAFSKDYSININHDKICGSHIVDGTYYKGYANPLINGAIVFHNEGEYVFLADSIEAKIKSFENVQNSYGFCQIRLDTAIVSIPQDRIYFEKFGLHGYRSLEGKLRLSKTAFKYRALCEKGNKICIIESREEVCLTQFKKNLIEYGVSHALYLDTGIGWSYSWYRDNLGMVQILHPYIHPFNTNWLIFYK